MSGVFGRLALHMWTIDTTPLAAALDAAKQAGYDAVELRRNDFKRCFEAGMVDHLAKPVMPEDLLQVLLRWARRPEVPKVT